MMNKHERKGRAMDRRAHYRKIYQDTITRAGIVEGRPLTDYEKGVFAGIIATRERATRLIEEGYEILDTTAVWYAGMEYEKVKPANKKKQSAKSNEISFREGLKHLIEFRNL